MTTKAILGILVIWFIMANFMMFHPWGGTYEEDKPYLRNLIFIMFMIPIGLAILVAIFFVVAWCFN